MPPSLRDMYALTGLNQQAIATPETMQRLALYPVEGVNVHTQPDYERGSPSWIRQQTIEPVEFGSMADPVSQLAFLAAPGVLRASKATLEALATPGPRLGGVITGRRGSVWAGGTGPRGDMTPEIYVRPEDIKIQRGWGNDPPIRTVGGEWLKGTPVQQEDLPETLYHVTTNAPAVRASGGLKHMPSGTASGLGKGTSKAHQGVSLTSDPQTAAMIERELSRAAQIGKGEADFPGWLSRVIDEDARLSGVPRRLYTDLEKRVLQTHADIVERAQGLTAADRANVMRDANWRALKQYWSGRESEGLGFEDPIMFGQAEEFGRIAPKDIQTLAVPRSQIPASAYIRDNPLGGRSSNPLNEIMVHGDIPLRFIE